jgi:hypothetical protein
MARAKSIADVLGRESVHPFPARMAASLALAAVTRSRTSLKVLDPMMGSGTVLAVAQSKGHFACGIDIDPLAILIGRVWTTAIDKNSVRKKATEVLISARKDFRQRSRKDAYPKGADKETRKFLRYWFDPYARHQLASLSAEIRKCKNRKTKNALWCAFSRLIVAKQAGASLALDLSHSRPHKFFEVAPRKPFDWFLDSVEHVLSNTLSKTQKGRGRATSIKLGDARHLPIRANSVDLVLTSPPYLNAIDYMRCSKFSLVWMGETAEKIRKVRRSSIGAEVGEYDGDDRDFTTLLKSLKINSKLSQRHKAILRRFTKDMTRVVQETSRVLVPGGKAVFVIGENELKGTFIRNSKIIAKLALNAGLKLDGEKKRTLPPNRRYLPPPTKSRGAIHARMRQEVVLEFSKRKQSRS